VHSAIHTMKTQQSYKMVFQSLIIFVEEDKMVSQDYIFHRRNYMKKRALFIILLSFSLILTSVPPSFATEKNTSKENDSFKNHEEFTEEIDGLKTNL